MGQSFEDKGDDVKATLCAIILVLISVPAIADDDWKGKCSRLGDLSKIIMKARQVGVPMAKVMETADSKVEELMIIAAYDKPRYSTPKIQQQTIGDFGDEWYAQCVKELRK